MQLKAPIVLKDARAWMVLLALTMTAGVVRTSPMRTDDVNARNSVKSMSDYMAAQGTYSFDYDTYLEVVTKQNQKLGLASSGSITVNRPDKIHATRTGGFADVEYTFDGKMLTMFGKNLNAYAQTPAAGTLDQLVDALRDKYRRPVPGADLLMSSIYDQLMPQVTDAKDLGSGVIGGVECDHLAFRTNEVDWEVWIAQGSRRYPCRYVVTSTHVTGAPQYTIDLRNWKTGSEVASDRFAVDIPADAKMLQPGELRDFDELPAIFAMKKEGRRTQSW